MNHLCPLLQLSTSFPTAPVLRTFPEWFLPSGVCLLLVLPYGPHEAVDKYHLLQEAFSAFTAWIPHSIPVLCWEYYHFLPSFLMLLGQRLCFPSKLDVNFEMSDRNETQLWGCVVASATTVG